MSKQKSLLVLSRNRVQGFNWQAKKPMWITLDIGFQLVSNDAHPARLSEDPIYSLFQNESDITILLYLC